MIAQWLHAIGLSLGIVGVLILFTWRSPQRDGDPHFRMGAHGEDEDTKRKRRRYWFLSGVGLGLVGVVFAAPLVGAWCSWLAR
jgi:hypothetical protein